MTVFKDSILGLFVACPLILGLGCAGQARSSLVPPASGDRGAQRFSPGDDCDGPTPPPKASLIAIAASAAQRVTAPTSSPAVEKRSLGVDGPRSEPLACGLSNPMPGGVTAGYSADTGLDLAGSPRDVFAIASGTLDYAEAGHTLWNGRHDSKLAARITLDEPIRLGDRTITHVWYAHLSEVALELHEGSGELIHVAAGQRLGRSGTANGSPHLHLGMLLDGDVSQSWGTFLLEDDVRRVLCRWSKGKRLPDPANDKLRSVGRPALARGRE